MLINYCIVKIPMANSVLYDLDHPLMISKFKNIGLAREDVKGLPEDISYSLANGALSPLMLLKIKQADNTFLMPAKIQIAIDEKTKQPELYIYGVTNKIENSYNLNSHSFEEYKKGKILLVKEKDQVFLVQIDPETKNPLKISSNEIDQKLNSLEKILDIELGKEQRERIKEGKPVTLEVGGENVTIGVDLRSPHSFKQLKGDMKEWERQKAIDYDIAHPEYVGIVQTDQNRWEKHMIQTQGYNSPELKQAPQQVKSAGIKL